MADSHQMFIDGEWVNSSDGGTRDIISPHTGVGDTGNDSRRLLLRGIGDTRHGCAAHKDHGANGHGERTDYASHLPCDIGPTMMWPMSTPRFTCKPKPNRLPTRATLAWF